MLILLVSVSSNTNKARWYAVSKRWGYMVLYVLICSINNNYSLHGYQCCFIALIG